MCGTDDQPDTDTFPASTQLDVVSSYFEVDQTDIIDDEEMKMRSCFEYVGYFGTTSGTPGPVKSAADDIEEEQQSSWSAVGLGHAVSGYAQSSTEDRSAPNDVEQPASSKHLNLGAASSSSVDTTPGTVPVEHL